MKWKETGSGKCKIAASKPAIPNRQKILSEADVAGLSGEG